MRNHSVGRISPVKEESVETWIGPEGQAWVDRECTESAERVRKGVGKWPRQSTPRGPSGIEKP